MRESVEALAKPIDSQGGTGILPVFRGGTAHATKGFARTSVDAYGDACGGRFPSLSDVALAKSDRNPLSSPAIVHREEEESVDENGRR
jgi:hypothetical protein